VAIQKAGDAGIGKFSVKSAPALSLHHGRGSAMGVGTKASHQPGQVQKVHMPISLPEALAQAKKNYVEGMRKAEPVMAAA
jgi:hypothetical protein